MYLLYSVVIYRTVNVSMKVEHDLLCNECLSPAGTVAAAATQPRPTDRAGGCCLNFYCLGLSRNVQLCYCLSNSQISPYYLLLFTPVLYSSDSPSKTILKPYAMKLCCKLYVTALKCHKNLCLQCLCSYIIHSVLELRLIGKNYHKNRKPFPAAAAVGFELHCGVHRGRIALFYLNYRL